MLNRAYLICCAIIIMADFLYAQDTLRKTPGSPVAEGISVSPSSMRFALKQGSAESRSIRVGNSTNQTFKFKITFTDFIMNDQGKPVQVVNGTNKFGLSKWIVAAPSFFEVGPNSAQNITVTVAIPSQDSVAHAAWTIIMIDQIKERESISAGDGTNTIALGIQPSFAFGVYVYQNPPNVQSNKVIISNANQTKSDSITLVNVTVKNTGDGIGFCTLQLEMVALANGKEIKLPVRKFTILPGAVRIFSFQIPSNLDKGVYSVVALLDYGSKDVIEGAELEVKVE
jgi:hypothetical protein